LNPIDEEQFTRRHSRFYEMLILGLPFQFILGIFLILSISIIPKWGTFFWTKIDNNSQYSLYGVIIIFIINLITLEKIIKFPGVKSLSYILPTTTILMGFLLGFFLIYRISYSTQILFSSYFSLLLFFIGNYFINKRYRINRYGLIPFGEALEFSDYHGALFSILKEPDLKEQRFNAIVADLRSPDLSPEWERFLAKCTLSRIPVFHSKQLKESFTGRVKIDHLSENEFGSLMPSLTYEYIKRLLDLILVVLIFPIFTIILIIFSFWIKLDSKGPIFFSQMRMGYRGKAFIMYKLRSMYINKSGTDYTIEKEDPRITNVGKIIRKFRIDELPQILNVLKGDMSFIGPRPESFELSKWYEKDVPFFPYRHIVRPGLSGWAQVNQGYAAEIDGMKIKLEYDFYYIKNFSFWLDILIIFKTVRIILTGFGAR
jgi:lipopolysaccharide/colanic/teichoic acid biosynthesis glycosyltransferase